MESLDPIRICFCDIDGTLLPFGGKDLSGTVDAAGRIIDAGIDFVLCTGRGIGTIPKPLYRIRGLRYAITGNGAMVWDLQKDIILRERRLDPKTAKAIIRESRKMGLSPAGYQHGISYLDTACPEPVSHDNFAMWSWLKNARRTDLLAQEIGRAHV